MANDTYRWMTDDPYGMPQIFQSPGPLPGLLPPEANRGGSAGFFNVDAYLTPLSRAKPDRAWVDSARRRAALADPLKGEQQLLRAVVSVEALAAFSAGT